MMKRFIISLVVVFSVTVAFAQNATPVDPVDLDALRAEIAALQQQLAALQVATSQPQFTVAVMEIGDSWRIPEVGDSFRETLLSALREQGILAVESLDRETQTSVDRQRQAVAGGYVDPRTVPPAGTMLGVRYFLFGTVTKYEEDDREDNLGGVVLGRLLKVGGRVRLRTGSLVVDFRLVDAQTGIAVDAFRTEAAVRDREVDGLELNGFSFGGRSRQRTLPELAARECARQAAARVRQFAAPTTAAVESTSMRLTPPPRSR